MLYIYIKNKKLQTNIIHAGQDLEPTNIITKKWAYEQYDYKELIVCRQLLNDYYFIKQILIYTDMITNKNTNIIIKKTQI